MPTDDQRHYMNNLLRKLGLEEDPDAKRMGEILIGCLEKYKERNAKYRGAWKKFGYMDTLMHVRSKQIRLEAVWGDPEVDGNPDDLDDAEDLIVYTLFTMMNIADNNERGDG